MSRADVAVPNVHPDSTNDSKTEAKIDHPYTEIELKSLNEMRQLIITYLKSKREPGPHEKDVVHWMKEWRAEGSKPNECGYLRRHARVKDIATWEKRCKVHDEQLAKQGISLHPPTDPEQRISLIPNYELYRYLRARKMKVQDAAEMYFNYLNWYDRFGVVDLIRFQQEGRAYDMPNAAPLRSVCAWLHHGYDKQGRPIYIENVGNMDCYRFNALMSPAEVLQTHIWFLEYCRKRCETASQRAGKRIDHLVQIFDCAGVGLGHRTMIKYFKATIMVDQSYYPETLGAMYFINCPRFFYSLWALCQPFLDPVTKQKIRVLGKDTKQLLDELGAENVPVEYGGTCTSHTSPTKCMPELIPIPDLDGTLDSDEKFEEKEISAGQKHIHDIKITESQQHYGVVMWQFKVAAKDITFHAEWHPADGSPHTEIHPPTRVSHDPLFTPGSHDLTAPGMLRLVWDNSFSRFTSKKIIYRVYRVTTEEALN